MELNLENGAFLLSIAAIVAILTRRLRLPYSVGLVVAGVAVAILPFTPKVSLTKDLIFTALLPPLIFEAAFSLRWKYLRRDLPVILTLATAGVLLSAAITSVGMHFAAAWTWPAAMIFGVLIAATDPVAVLATFREAKARGRLLLLVEAESLFNDATAAVAFTMAIALTSGRSITALESIGTLLLTVGGGLLAGGIVAAVVLLLAGRTEDHLVELTFTTIAAYGSFLLAEHFHGSGVLATLTAGLMLRNYGTLGILTMRGIEAVRAFWQFAAFVANSLVFLLIGMHEAQQHFAAMWLAIAAAILLVILGRAAAIYPLCLLFSQTSMRVTMRHQHILFWGGLRGALALALALGLPPETPGREAIITVSFAVVAFSLFVQGLSMAPLLRRMGEISDP